MSVTTETEIKYRGKKGNSGIRASFKKCDPPNIYNPSMVIFKLYIFFTKTSDITLFMIKCVTLIQWIVYKVSL